MIGFFMRFASQILALFLAITTIATPCLAKIQTGPAPATTEIAFSEVDDEHCKGPCLKAIVARPDHDNPAVVQTTDDSILSKPLGLLQPSLPKRVSTFKSPSPPCHHPVDLFFLCRQLN